MNDDRFDSNAERAPTRTAAARLLVDLDGRAFKVGVQSKAFSIGSDDACSLVVDRPGVAARHAVIQRDGDRFEIFDLLSSTGTFVNGRRVEAATLTSGDAIRVGDARLVFLRDEPAPPAPAKGTSEADATAVASLGFFEPTPPAPKADPETEATWTSFPPIVADAPLPEPLTPPRKPRYVGPDRRARTDFPEFGELLIFQLRRTPFMATSIVAHGILVVLVLLFAEPGKIPVLRGPTRTERFDYALVDETPPEATRDAPDIEAANPETPIGEPEFVESNDAPWGEAEELSSPTPEDLDLGPFRDVRGGVASAGSLDLGGLLGAASGDGPSLRRLSSDLKGVGLDVVLVVDATGSMGPVIEAARGALVDAAVVLSAVAPTFRLGVVAFRDEGDDFVVKSVKLTRRHFEVVDFLDGLTAEGGGDFEEAVEVALAEATTRMNFDNGAKRIVVLAGDAPPRREKRPTAMAYAESHARRGGVLHTLYCPPDPRLGADVRAYFGELSKRGGGLAASLDASSTLAASLLPVLFGEAYRESMTAAVREATQGSRAARWRGFVENASAERIKRELSFEKASTPYLLAAIARKTRPEHLPAFLDVAADPAAPSASRWAAAVFAKRVVRAASPPRRLAELAEAIRPDDSPSALADRIALVRAGAEALGMRAAALPAIERSKKTAK